MEVLLYINSSEYKEGIQASIQIAATEVNPHVEEFASNALNYI